MKSSGQNLKGDDLIFKNPKTMKNTLLKTNCMNSLYKTRIERCNHRQIDMKMGDHFWLKRVKRSSATTLT